MQSNFTYSHVWVGKGSTAVSNFSIFGWPICYRYRYLLLREQGVKGTVSRDLYVGSPSRWLAPRLAYPLSIGHYPYYCSHFLSTSRWKFFCFFSLQHSFWLRINYTQLMADHWSTPVAWPLQHSYWLNTAALLLAEHCSSSVHYSYWRTRSAENKLMLIAGEHWYQLWLIARVILHQLWLIKLLKI